MFAQLDFTENRFKIVNLVGDETVGIIPDLIRDYPNYFVCLDGRDNLPDEINCYYDSETDLFVPIEDVIFPEPELEPLTPLEEISNTQLTMMEAMADQYEQNLKSQITSMEVQATIYETLLDIQGGTTP